MATFHASFNESSQLRASFVQDHGLDAEFGEVIKVVDVDPYEGPYEVTPTQETQILATEMLLATEDIIVNPIPSNYGLITWNGSVLRVS